MKKLFITAGLFLAMASVNAQQTKHHNDNNRPPQQENTQSSVDREMRKFDNLNLSKSQKRRIRALLEQRNNGYSHNNERPQGNNNYGGNNNLDSQLRKILTAKQYAKYKSQNQGNHNQNRPNGNQNRPDEKTLSHKVCKLKS